MQHFGGGFGTSSFLVTVVETEILASGICRENVIYLWDLSEIGERDRELARVLLSVMMKRI